MVLTSALSGDGVAELDAAAEAHRVWRARHVATESARRQRRRAHVRALVARRLAEVIDAGADAWWDADVASAYHAVVAGLDYPAGE